MAFLGKILGAMAPQLLDWGISKLITFGAWVGSKYKTSAKKRKALSQVDRQRDRLKAAIDNGYNGDDITPEEKKEIIDAARALVRDY